LIAAFGPAAERFAAGLRDVDAIVTDQRSAPKAFLEAVKWRERGQRFYGMLLLEDRRSTVTCEVAHGMIEATPDPEYCELLLQQLARGDLVVNGTPLRELWADTGLTFQISREFATLPDAMLVRSFTEYAWIADLFAERPPPQMARAVVEPPLPAVAPPASPQQPGLVIWAPYRDAAFVALHAFTLGNVHGEVTCVVQGGALPAGLGLPLLAPDDPRVAGVLSRATAIVCVEPNDPGDAIAFARRGYGVVAPMTSGAHEYLADVQIWDGCTVNLLHAAAVAALGRPASVKPGAVSAPAPLAVHRPAPITLTEPPLVSILMPTYNRRELLAKVLTSVAAQSYPRIEAVVVNDAGIAVDDVVAPYPFVTLVVHEQNRGVMAACRTGYEAAKGDYITFLPDDDWIYPDHVERIMSALLHAGASVAHSAALLRYLKTGPDGGDVLRGFNMSTFSKTIDLREALIASTVSLNQTIQHRSVFENVGWFLDDSAVTDNEFHMRLLQHYTPVFAPNVTCEFRDYDRPSLGKSADLGAALKHVYEHVHPFPNRPVLNDVRQRTLASIALRRPGESPFQPSITVP